VIFVGPSTLSVNASFVQNNCFSCPSSSFQNPGVKILNTIPLMHVVLCRIEI
jgi:hypothetical protein